MSAGGPGGGPRPAAGGRVIAVEPGSPAERAALRPGDVVMRAGDEVLSDSLAWQWASDGQAVEVLVAPGGEAGRARVVQLERGRGEPWGLGFEGTVFDGVRTCRNDCVFCFVAQLPAGLRPALYVRDDDYRLSFLDDNFITLTNLTDADVDRILRHRLSPLYVSLHAVTPSVRARLLCPGREDRALEVLDTLLVGGIEVHVQIVLVPRVNDGSELQRTLEWLADRPRIASVGVVPVGHTSHGARVSASYGTLSAARAIVEALAPWRARMSSERGSRWVHAADELLLNACAAIPPADDYDGFPQYENGIGLVRDFLDGWDEVRGQLAESVVSAPRATIATGTLFAPVLATALSGSGFAERVRVLPVPNLFFGGNVSVTGLLSAADIAAAVREDGDDGPYLVPDVVLNADGVTLDDVAGSELAAASGADVRLVSSDAAGLGETLAALAREQIG